MYQLLRSCSQLDVRVCRKTAGWGTLRMARRRTRSGSQDASAHATLVCRADQAQKIKQLHGEVGKQFGSDLL